MEITSRSLWTLIHGMGFGALYLLACSGALVELYRRFAPPTAAPSPEKTDAFLSVYLSLMAAFAWLTVLTGTYLIYPWYRVAAPAGTTHLGAFPQRLLLSSSATAGWHSFGMEWKEHVAWLVPICITMAAVVVVQYGRDLRHHPQLRTALLAFVFVSLLAASIAGFFGAMLNKHAPVEGDATIGSLFPRQAHSGEIL
jgi:hypothetical membrane protein